MALATALPCLARGDEDTPLVGGVQQLRIEEVGMPLKSRIYFSSMTDRWRTPTALYQALDAEFQFTFDPCPLDGLVDGLSPLFSSWAGQRVFCNPPYGPGIPLWLHRAREAELAVFLIPARTDTKWFHDIVLPTATEIRFLRGRLRFGGSTENAPFPSMVVIFT